MELVEAGKSQVPAQEVSVLTEVVQLLLLN